VQYLDSKQAGSFAQNAIPLVMYLPVHDQLFYLAADPARFTAHRFLIASANRFRVVLLKPRFLVAGASAAASIGAAAFFAAQRFFSAAISRFLPSGVM